MNLYIVTVYALLNFSKYITILESRQNSYSLKEKKREGMYP